MSQMVNGMIVGQENTNSFRYRKKHAKQGRALTSASLTIMGAAIAMGVLLFDVNELSSIFQNFFFAGMIGGTALLVLTHIFLKLRKVIIYYFAAVLLFISGLLFSALNINTINSVDLIKSASFFSGAAIGIAVLTFIIHSGEISVKYLRGSVLTNIQMSIDGGIFITFIYIQVIYLIIKNGGNALTNPTLGVGILQIVFGILAFITAYFFVYESPIFLIEAGNEQEAIKNLNVLRGEPLHILSHEVHNEIEEIKMILRNKSHSASINGDDIRAFLKVFILRFAFTLGTSVPVNFFIVTIFTKSLSIAVVVLYMIRFISNIIPVFFIDIRTIGRKILLTISFLGSGIMLIAITALTSKLNKVNTINDVTTLGVLTILYFIFLGLGGSTVSYVYMSEVFNHSKKVYLNAIIIILECIVQIFIINLTSNNITIGSTSFETLFYLTASLQFIVGLLSLAIMPETQGKTLLEAENVMKKANVI